MSMEKDIKSTMYKIQKVTKDYLSDEIEEISFTRDEVYCIKKAVSQFIADKYENYGFDGGYK